MPDLTPQAPSNVTAQAPTSSVSPQQVASPFLELAKALDQSGDALTGVASNLAEQAGFKAVTRDDQGNIQVEKAPIIGPASAAYSRAVKMAALAAGEGDAKRADIALRQQYRDDPAGYLAASDAFKTDTQALYTKQAGPEVGIAVGRAIDATTTQTYRGLLNESERLNLQRADKAITAQIQSSRDDAVALARGGDTESEAFQKAVQTVHTLTNERVNNPRLAYPPDKAMYDLQQFDGDLKANGFLYHIDQIYKDKSVADDGSAKGGAQPALVAAQSILSDPSIKLTEDQRNAYYHKAVGEIHANEAIRKQDLSEARTAVSNLMLVSASGGRVEPEDIEQAAQGLRAAGDPAGASRLYATFARKPLNDDFGRQPLAAQTQQVNDLQGNARQKGAYDFFVGKGWTPEQAAGIVGGLRGETANLNPTQSHDGGIGIGISGWNADRRAALTDFARANKLNPFELNTQLEFVDYELKHNESAAGAALKNATTPEQAGNAMLGYFRPKDFDVPGAHPERAQYSRQAYDAFGPNGTGAVAYSTAGGATPPNPASTLWLQANRERTLNVNAQAAWKTVMQDYETKGIRPAPAIIDQIVDAARATNNHALLEGIAAGTDRMNIVQDQGGAPLPAQHAAVTALEAAGQAGQLSPGQHAILKDLQAKSAAITAGLKENPIQTAIVNFPDRFRTPAPLDVTDQNALVGGLKQRAQIAQFAASNWQTGPLQIMDKSDMRAVTGAMQGDHGSQVLGAIGQALKPPEMQALLADEGFRQSVTGMSRSGDPAKMNAAYSFMDAQQKQNPLQFEKQFPEGLKDLRAWQSNLAFYPPAEAAKRLMRSYDPDQKAARRAADDVADKALKTVSPDSVVSKFSTGFGPFGTGARSPVDTDAGIAKGALKADYDKNYKDGFAATGDATMADNFAMEKLKLKYAVSPTNGNRVMANAPERYYPKVDGSYDWMGKQLDDAVAQHLGVNNVPDLAAALANTVEPTASLMDERSPAERQYGSPHALVSDTTTDRDIASGKPPSYQIIIQDPNGRWQVMGGQAPVRFRFDPSTPFSDRAKAAEAARPTMIELAKVNQFGSAVP